LLFFFLPLLHPPKSMLPILHNKKLTLFCQGKMLIYESVAFIAISLRGLSQSICKISGILKVTCRKNTYEKYSKDISDFLVIHYCAEM